MILQLNLVITNWERSGEGGGGVLCSEEGLGNNLSFGSC